eukprot:CAMPEP_0204155414 /NCGR_PEP_ID=MMETSP0361-20130328/29583_1 /ASSEMBLY_ACC=CAM_ASM_000343 /TAXON_ID=268821 /ORGANISM="Scrippsiella Hangoei, Strain SHTV-5" /LENGTH=30 /DNA_ID= /DNA_START= /DNA_END= /DNA_ORIENTATION=
MREEVPQQQLAEPSARVRSSAAMAAEEAQR